MIFKRKVNLIVHFVLYIIISSVCVYFSASLSDGTAAIIQDELILPFLGLFASLAIACITFMYSNIEKIRNSIYKTSNYDEKMDGIIERLFRELKQDTIATVVSLVVCFIIILIRDINISVITLYLTFITKQQLVSIIEIILVFITFRAVIDIMLSLFGMINISSIMFKNRKS